MFRLDEGISGFILICLGFVAAGLLYYYLSTVIGLASVMMVVVLSLIAIMLYGGYTDNDIN